MNKPLHTTLYVSNMHVSNIHAIPGRNRIQDPTGFCFIGSYSGSCKIFQDSAQDLIGSCYRILFGILYCRTLKDPRQEQRPLQDVNRILQDLVTGSQTGSCYRILFGILYCRILFGILYCRILFRILLQDPVWGPILQDPKRS